MASDDLEEESSHLAEEYSSDFTKEIVTEIKQLKEVHEANFERDQLMPLDLLNSIYQYKLENLFPNICQFAYFADNPCHSCFSRKILQQAEACKELFALNHVTRSFSRFSKT